MEPISTEHHLSGWWEARAIVTHRTTKSPNYFPGEFLIHAKGETEADAKEALRHYMTANDLTFPGE